MNHAILLISCQDQKGITASVTSFLYEHNGNIIHAEQHIDEQDNTFFMRIEWSLEGFDIAKDHFHEQWLPLVTKFNMKWEFYFSSQKSRVAIFVSKHLHCLYDLLLRQRSGHFACDIPLIISNHSDAKKVADEFSIAFHEFPITHQTKAEQEKKELKVLKQHNIDCILLARYHQIFTKEFCSNYPNQIINIHHSFLPAFAGKSPYLQAYQNGVKIIGATSHYVTPELDEGPIIEQDTIRMSHRDSLKDLIRKGEDLEKIVLSRAVRRHLERKVLVYGNKTVVFD